MTILRQFGTSEMNVDEEIIKLLEFRGERR